MSNSGAATRLAERIEEARIEAGLSHRDLSDRSGIAYSTLRRKLQVTPDLLTVKDTAAIAFVLEADFDALFVRNA